MTNKSRKEQYKKRKGEPTSMVAIMGFGLLLTAFGILLFAKSSSFGGEFMENFIGYEDQKCVNDYLEKYQKNYEGEMPTRQQAKQHCKLLRESEGDWIRCEYTWDDVKDKVTTGVNLDVICIVTTGSTVICTGATAGFIGAGLAVDMGTNCDIPEGTYAGIRGSKFYKQAMLVKVIAEEGIELGILGVFLKLKQGATNVVQAARGKRVLTEMSNADIKDAMNSKTWRGYVVSTSYSLSNTNSDLRKTTLKVFEQEQKVHRMMYEGMTDPELDAQKDILKALRAKKAGLVLKRSKILRSLETAKRFTPKARLTKYASTLKNTIKGLKKAKSIKTATKALDTASKTKGVAGKFVNYGIPAIGVGSAGIAVVAVYDPELLPLAMQDTLSAMDPLGVNLRAVNKLSDWGEGAYDMITNFDSPL